MAQPVVGLSPASTLPMNPGETRVPEAAASDIVRYIDLKLAALGYPADHHADSHLLEIARPLLRNYHQKDVMLGNLQCPADRRIQAFLDSTLRDVCPLGVTQLPANTFLLDRPGLARVMSLPFGRDTFSSPFLQSYRLPQGILHNPKSDRRTTQGIFHIVEGGLPVPADKLAVPKKTFAALLAAAFEPPADLLTLPFTADEANCARFFVSLLLRPAVCPATEQDPVKSMEIRFFAPASLVSNLDFVEAIFGNAGDPYLPENDAALDPMHWTGHSGCVIVAPHLAGMKKRDLGLPQERDATERQRRDGMFWRDPDEPYNGGGSFKVACRDERGVMVTIIADNYYGYCKKEVKTQISFAANLYGLCEEEHAGGAIAFATYVLGQEFRANNAVSLKKARYADTVRLLGPAIDLQPEGYAIDRKYPDILYVPEDAELNVRKGFIQWPDDKAPCSGWPCALTPPMCCPTAFAFEWRSNPAVPRGGSSERVPVERSATSPARYPAAANRKFRNRSAISSWKGRSSWATTSGTSNGWRKSWSWISRPSTRTGRRTRAPAAPSLVPSAPWVR